MKIGDKVIYHYTNGKDYYGVIVNTYPVTGNPVMIDLDNGNGIRVVNINQLTKINE